MKTPRAVFSFLLFLTRWQFATLFGSVRPTY